MNSAVIYLDNLNSHKTGIVLNYLKKTGMNILFGPAYSPDLNPIEFFFNTYKAELLK